MNSRRKGADSERREVAARLRGPECKHKWRYQIMNDEKKNDVSNKLMDAAKRISKDDVACVLNDALHGEKKLSGINENCSTCCSVSLAELADLVKPSCDRDALLALAEELDGLGLSGFSSGWSSGTVNVGYFARRIREALGVSDESADR